VNASPGRMALYALAAALEMARGGDERPLTVAQAARATSIPEPVLAKVVQQLVRAGLAVGTRGSAGGYRLARPAGAITVLDVLAAFTPAPARAERGSPLDPRIAKLLDEIDEQVRCTYASVTLATLAGGPPAL